MHRHVRGFPWLRITLYYARLRLHEQEKLSGLFKTFKVMAAHSEPLPAKKRLDSWKEIAAFFDRDERTVKRWEKERGLPVYRVPGSARGGVFAYAEELAEWLKAPHHDWERRGSPPQNLFPG